MPRFIRRLASYALILEFHEWLSLLMLCLIAVLYHIGLDSTFFSAAIHTAYHGGPVTKMFFLLLAALGLTCIFLGKGRMARAAKLLLRTMSSFFIMIFSFESINHFIEERNLPLLDSMLQEWDSALFFGKQPAVWLEPLISTPLTGILSGAYLSWFLLVYGTVFIMQLKSRREVIAYTATALTTFYIGYVFYMFVPGIGPLYTYTFSTPMGGLTALMVNPDFIKPAANVFPSLHTGTSIVMLVQVWSHSRRWTWLYAPFAALIIFSTIYLRIHYAVDVIAGILLAVLTTQLCPYMLDAWERWRLSVRVLPATERKTAHSQTFEA